MLLIAKFRRKPLITKEEYKPELSILIAAYNEEDLISDCLESIIKSEYPIDKIRIFVGSDGSSDNTNDIVDKYVKGNNNFKLVKFPRSGKNKVLNELMKEVKTPITFFLDADLRLREGSLSDLVNILSDDNTGAALASVNIISDKSGSDAGSHGETVYQKYESFLRQKESQIYSNINSLGTLYGIKTEYFKPFPSDKVCDDLFNLFSVALQRKRVIFDKTVKVDEVRSKSIGQEFYRRVRVVAGGLSTAAYSLALLSPAYGLTAFFIWSHKILRWLSPVFLIMLLLLTFTLRYDSVIRDILFYSQLFFYLLSLAGYILDKFNVSVSFLKLAYFYVSMNLAFLFGIFRFIRGKQNSVWNRQGLAD